MNKNIFFCLLLFLYLDVSAQQWEQTGIITGGGFYGLLYTYMNDNGTIVASGNTLADGENGIFNVFQYDEAGSWNQLGFDFEVPDSYSQMCYYTLNSSGNRVALAYMKYPNYGNGILIRVFEYNGSSWEQLGADIIGDERLVRSLSFNLEGNRLLVNKYDIAAQRYKVEIYEYNGISWGEQQEIEGLENSYISAYSCDGSTIAGAYYQESSDDLSDIHVYTYNGNEWVQKGNTITGFVSDFNLRAGISFNSNGNIIAIGDPNKTSSSNTDDPGHVYVYSYSENTDTWEPMGQVLEGEQVWDKFGHSVNLNADGSRILISAPSSNNWMGKVKAYDYDATTGSWLQIGEDIEVIDSPYYYFGTSLCLSEDGKHIAVGATTEQTPYTGRVYTFKLEDEMNVAEILPKATIVLYPNPVKEVLYFTGKENIRSIQVFDLNGKLLITKQTDNQSFSELNVVNLQKGVYLVRITSTEQVHEFKIMKQ